MVVYNRDHIVHTVPLFVHKSILVLLNILKQSEIVVR